MSNHLVLFSPFLVLSFFFLKGEDKYVLILGSIMVSNYFHFVESIQFDLSVP